MNNQPEDRTMQQVWQAQSVEAPRISLEFVRHRTLELNRRVMHKNLFQDIAVGAGIVFYCFSIWRLPMPIVRIGLALVIVGFLFVLYQWHRRAAVETAPSDAGVMDALTFHRRQLERQRDVRKNSLRWSVAPLVPGVFTIFLGLALELHPVSWMRFWIFSAATVVLLAVGNAFKERTAKRLQQEIDALDSLGPRQG